MMVIYSPEIFDENPRRKPFGLVVVNPTRIFSAMVDLQLPMKSYFMMDSGRMFTPISVEYRKFTQHSISLSVNALNASNYLNISNYFKGYLLQTICTDRTLECSPSAVTFETIIAFKTCTIVETRAAFTLAYASWTYTYKIIIHCIRTKDFHSSNSLSDNMRQQLHWNMYNEKEITAFQLEMGINCYGLLRDILGALSIHHSKTVIKEDNE
jgi:hypothetical protein